MTALEQVTKALDARGCKGRNGSYQCPSHDDRHESLSVRETSPGGCGVKCHAGCTAEEIMGALGLATADLFDERPKEVARYNYVNYSGEIQFAKIRYQPKTFSIESPSNGSWKPGLNGGTSERPLYRLPDVLRAVQRGQVVWLVNGEKSADRLAEMGLAATCNYEGEGTWKPGYGDYLKGAHVVMVVDRDETGAKHASDVRKDLKHKAASLRFVQSKTQIEHDDVVDHLDAGYTLDELIPYFPQNEISKKYKPVDWREAFASQPGETQWLFPPLIEAGTINVLFGLPGVGKSLLVLEIILEVLRDGKCVLSIDEENRITDVVERMKKFGVTGHNELENLVWLSFPQMPALDTPDGGEHVTALAEAYKPDLVVMDTTTRMVEGDENSSSTWLQLYRNSLVPLKQRGIAVLRLDHQGKDASRGQRGSSAKDGDCDAIWRLRFQDGGYLALEREKSRSGHGEDWILVRREQDPLHHVFEELNHLPVTPRMQEWSDRFDDWGIPRNAGRPTLRAAIEERWGKDPGVSTTILALVARYRKGLDSSLVAA